MNESIKNALIIAIRELISEDELLSEKLLISKASNFVNNNKEYIREIFIAKVDFDDIFNSVLVDIDLYDIW